MRAIIIFISASLWSCGVYKPKKPSKPPVEQPGPQPEPGPPEPGPQPEPEPGPQPEPEPGPQPEPEPGPQPEPEPGPQPEPPLDSVVAKNGFLQVSGSKIVNQHGKEIQLKGMSLFWSQWSSSFYNAGAVKTVAKDWNATVIRAAMGIEMGGYLQNPEAQKALINPVIEAAIKEGIYVIVDWHDHNAEAHEEQAIAFFSELAEKYKDTPNLIFELYNEPIRTPWWRIKQYAENVTAAIREKGAKHLVIVGTPSWSQDVDQAARDPLSDSNVAYALHFYASTHKGWLRDKAQFAMNQGIALFVTEFGTTEASGDGYVDLRESDIWMDFMEKNGISWANWSLFDKAESSASLKPGSSPYGDWKDEQLTTSGKYIKDKIKGQSGFSSAQINIYGDSIFATSWKQFGKELGRVTQKEIADYSTTGAWSKQIAGQYYRNKPRAESIVVFDGGGNDVLGSSGICRGENIEGCKPVVNKAIDIVSDLLSSMESDGVSKAIFVGPHSPRKFNSGYEPIINYTYGLLEDTCDASKICALVDARPILARDDLLEWDGVHPNVQGANLLAKSVSEAIK